MCVFPFRTSFSLSIILRNFASLPPPFFFFFFFACAFRPPPTPLTPNEEAHRAVSGALADALRDPQADAALFQRLCSRPELTVVLMTPREISALTPAQTQAWGAGGLRPAELRALHHVLQRTPPRGAGASGLQFVRQVAARVSELPASLPGAGMGGGEGVTTI